MFNYINCQYPLPNYKHMKVDDFQTKSMEYLNLDKFIISKDGNLMLDDEVKNYTGWIYFYTHINMDSNLNINEGPFKEIGLNYRINFEFDAEFLRGKLMSIKDESYVEVLKFDSSEQHIFKEIKRMSYYEFRDNILTQNK